MTRSSDSFEEQLKAAPARPGCYLFRDAGGRVLYVGKALDLRKRVQVYRRHGADGRFQLGDLLRRARQAEFLVVDNNQEALLLEQQLAQRHQPPLNVQLKDDKAFLLVHLDTRHRWPRIGLARRRQGPGEFFGPYASALAARRAKRYLQKAFGLRDCSDHTLANRSRPCLKHPIGLCSAPCVDRIEQEEYERNLDEARQVLRGKVAPYVARARERMEAASAEMRYETALRERDRMLALEALATPQKVRLEAEKDFDVIGIDERGQVAVLEYRSGDWIGTRRAELPVVQAPARMLSELIPALYRPPAEIPPEILVAAEPEGLAILSAWLERRADSKVAVLAPARGPRRAMVRLAESNARAQRGAASGAPWSVVAERLAEITGHEPPAVVDCIDISHLQGKQRVASKVRFVEGKAERSQYRRYLVGGGEGNDDYEAMREVLGRVFEHAERDGLADWIVLDGGRLQLDAGLQVAEQAEQDVPLFALAKARRGRGPIAAEERLFVPEREGPAVLERGSPERLFLERLRDEAHRFAIHYHRRRRENLRLVLEQVPGIGPTRRKTLLDAFDGDLNRIKDADPERLAQLPGMTAELAASVQEHLAQILP